MLAPDSASTVDRGRNNCLRGGHFHLRTRERKHELHIQRRRCSGIEIRGQCDRRTALDELTSRRIVTVAEHE